MTLADDIDLLRRIPLLADFTDEQLRLLAFGAEDRVLGPGTVLFEAGDRADSGFIIADGEIELRSPDDVDLLATVSTGVLIGETALMTETTRQCRAVTVSSTTVVQIRRSLFRRILREFPDLAARMQASLAEKLTGTMSDLARVRRTLDAIDES